MVIFLERFILAILAAIAVLLAVTNPMGFSVAARISGVVSIVVLAGIAAYFAERIQRKRVQGEQEEKRIFVGEGITPEYLVAFFHQHYTAVQATNATQDYIGKWMPVAGPIKNVRSIPDQAMVTFDRQSSTPPTWSDFIDVDMHFRGPWKDRAIILKKGDTIKVIGQITRISTSGLDLDNCEFAEVGKN